jgi:hypothetical protein
LGLERFVKPEILSRIEAQLEVLSTPSDANAISFAGARSAIANHDLDLIRASYSVSCTVMYYKQNFSIGTRPRPRHRNSRLRTKRSLS